MPRASRHFLPGQLWHLTHRCHEKAFLFRFARDRRRYRYWLVEAKERFGLCVLNYVVTSNHVHLLVQDTGERVIARSMQLVAGRIAQEYNQRKERQGAFWEDRYHATAIEPDRHLQRCLVYIDLNMVRAGVVRHPAAWAHGGYKEIQDPPKRYALIELSRLSALCGFGDVDKFQRAHRQWIEEALLNDERKRDARWSEALAVGSQAFVEQVKRNLALRARHREIEEANGSYALREPVWAYTGIFGSENARLGAGNSIIRGRNPINS
ncbi:MAG TPA: transposase [Burkholderiales bacterium]|jgi:putative transposase